MICSSHRCKVRTYNALNEKSVVDTMELPEILQILAPPPVQVKQELLSLSRQTSLIYLIEGLGTNSCEEKRGDIFI